MQRRRGLFEERGARQAFWVLVALAAAGLTVRLWIDARANQNIRADVSRLAEQAAEAEARTSELTNRIARFSSSTYVEAEARLKLGLRAPGEHVVILSSAATGSAVARNVTTKPVSNPVRWYRYFFETEK